jgi:hypothetical protein
VAAALRVRAAPGDEAQIWPPWAERARLFVEAVPVRAEEDLRAADYPAVERLWLVALFRSPRSGLGEAREGLRARGATAGDRVRFGALELEPWELHGPKVLAWLAGQKEEHEVDYVARTCVLIPLSGRLTAHGPSGVLHVRAGIVGERAYQSGRPPIRLEVRVDGAPAGSLHVPPTAPPESGWRRFDTSVRGGAHVYELAATPLDPDRPFCLAAWVSDR